MAIHIGFLPRINRSDAVARVRGLIRRQIIAPEASWWFLMATDGGFAYEIHEGGGGRAYLPSILERGKAVSGAIVHLRAGNRIVRVVTPEGRPHSVTLQEGVKEKVDTIAASARMTRYEPASSGVLITSGVLLAVAAVTFMATSIAVNSVSDPSQVAAAALRTRDLPIWHWPTVAAKGQYVSRVQLSGGHWTTRVSSAPVPAAAPVESEVRPVRPPAVPGPLAATQTGGSSK